MEVKFDVQMTTSKLYDFNLQHSYKKPVSIIATALGVVFMFLFFYADLTNEGKRGYLCFWKFIMTQEKSCSFFLYAFAKKSRHNKEE